MRNYGALQRLPFVNARYAYLADLSMNFAIIYAFGYTEEMVITLGLPRIPRAEISTIRRRIFVRSPKTGRYVRAKGFSMGELQELGISVEEARRMGLPVDRRRRTKYEHNLRVLRELLTRYGAEIRAPAPPIRPAETVAGRTAAETAALITVEDVCDRLLEFLGSAKRRKIDSLLRTLSDSLKDLFSSVGVTVSEKEASGLLDSILEDLTIAGFGRRTQTYFLRSEERHPSMAREIMLERIRRFVDLKTS